MRFHMVGLPYTQVTREFSSCALTEKIRKFTKMMKARGHEVIIYAGDRTEANCDELIACISEAERADFVGDRHYTEASWDISLPTWIRFNSRAAEELAKRAGPRDFICVSGGRVHKTIGDALPDHMVVEYSVGYRGTFAKYRVFMSYAWMHAIYAAEANNGGSAVGRWSDGVIPGFIDVEDFPTRDNREGYFLFLGRLVSWKGYDIALEACRRLGLRLILAGPGKAPPGSYHVGEVGPEVRAHLLAGAAAVFMPTTDLEPFGNVAVEAMMCGTPAITTDWGAFTETVIEGFNGFRCRTMDEFVQAARDAVSLDRAAIRKHAIAHYSLEAVGERYERYFERLGKTWDGGRLAPVPQSGDGEPG